MSSKKIFLILASLLLIVVSVGHATNESSNQFRIYKKRLNSKWWLSTSYLHDGFNFNSANAAGSLDNKGDSNIYRAEVSRFFPDEKLVVSALYKRITTDSESNSLIGTTRSHGFSKISSNLFGLNIKKVFGRFFYLATYGAYGPTHLRLSVSNEFLGTGGLSAAGNATYNGDFWYAGANTGALIPVGTDWLIGGVLNFIYVASNTDRYTLPQPGFPPISQSATSITTANLLQNFVVKYLITQHIRPYINAGLIEVLSQNVSNPSALLSAPVPDLLLGKFGYNAGGGLEYISHKVTFHIGYLYNRRESNYHSNFVYLRLSIFT